MIRNVRGMDPTPVVLRSRRPKICCVCEFPISSLKSGLYQWFEFGSVIYGAGSVTISVSQSCVTDRLRYNIES